MNIPEISIDLKEVLLKKIIEKVAVVGVVGLGYVGLPLAVENAKAGYKTIGIDIQKEKVNKVNAGCNYISDIIDEDLKKVVEDGRLKATTDFAFINELDCVVICVPTPLDEHLQPNISYIRQSVECVGQHLHKGMLIILESTTYPGTTEELVKPILEKISGLKCEEDFYLAFSPERVDPGNKNYHTQNTPKVVGGVGQDSTKLAKTLYQQILASDIYEVSSPAVAEMEKLLENVYRNINIGLINEMAIICNRMQINIWEVIDAAKTKPYGFEAFYPGPGIGGHCIPLDPHYLTYKAREFNYHTKLIETSSEINNYMPEYIVERISKILNSFSMSLRGSKILILGVAYKEDIDDYRESPVLKIMDILKRQGVLVTYHDPYISECQDAGIVYINTELNEKNLKEANLVVIATKHSLFDYDYIQSNAVMIFDLRNAMHDVQNRENVETL
ncbi:MAG: UDP-N-acetyl-D-glucosamine dehydrogenase [Firmicutes bacterium HGW-Firmicutes-1]|jgi:UDP-N-acetyl-D-glucosamine dehydrogenase|nr:MAG: UDP-N-acetyl-D-glucosamine dehydrogenase [Firmicutes bacterium HGW-Firmicutes-1]